MYILCLSVCLSLSLSLCFFLSLCLSLSLCLFSLCLLFSPFLSVSFSLSLSLSIFSACLSLSISFSLSLCLSIWFFFLFLFLSLFLNISFLSFFLSLSLFLSLHPSIFTGEKRWFSFVTRPFTEFLKYILIEASTKIRTQYLLLSSSPTTVILPLRPDLFLFGCFVYLYISGEFCLGLKIIVNCQEASLHLLV